VAWVKILILAQAMSAGSGCYGALARRNNLNAFSVARYRRRASVSCNASITGTALLRPAPKARS